ncbi:MAG: PD40 domain-containing protein [Gemmatimonadetes bacterium]|nr:PD40 domain-containing protein [Gemmatimonadota bacterium]
MVVTLVFRAAPRLDAQTTELVFREGTEMEAVPSPDGRFIALQLWRHIWVLDAGGGEARRLTDAIADPAEHMSPAWSPDGRTILFSMMFGDWQKRENPHLVPVTGGEPEAVAEAFAGAVAWSRDGSRFLCLRDGGLWSVSIADSTAIRLNPDSISAKDPAWSRDGRWVAFSSGEPWWSGRSLYVVSASGDSLRELTRGSDYAPSWSADGERVFFISERTGAPQIWSVPAQGGEPRQLTNEPEVYPFPPRWWPGRDVLLYTAAGKMRTLDPATGARDSIAFTARLKIRRKRYRPDRPFIPAPGTQLPVRGIYRPAVSPDGRAVVFAAMGELWLRNADGRVEQLTRGPEFDGDAAWSPDGERLAFVSEQDGEYTLSTMNLSDRVRRPLASTSGAQAPIWHPSGDSIVYRHGFNGIRIVSAAGGESRSVLQARGFGVQPLGWLPGARLLYWHAFQPAAARGTTTAIRSIGPAGDTATLIVSDPRNKIHYAALSANGDSVAYVSNGELWIRALSASASPGVPRRLLEGPVFFPAWSRAGRIVFVTGGRLLQVDRGSGAQRRLPVSLSYHIRSAPSLLLRNARILSPDPREGLWDLLLEAGRIKTIRPSGSGALQADSTVDLDARTIMPGLFDLHTHTAWFGIAPSDRSALLYRGITSIADLGSEGYWLLEQQEAIESGQIEGPRIFMGGPQVTGSAQNQIPHQLQVSSDGQAERYVDHLRDIGATHVKAYNQWDAAVEAAVIRAAHRRGLRALSHFLRPSAVAAGLDRKEHVDLQLRGWIDTRYRQDILEIFTKAGVTLVVTAPSYGFGNTERGIALERSVLADSALARLVSPARRQALLQDLERRQIRPDATRMLQAYLADIAAAHRAGVKIVVGTDTHLYTQEILELLVEAGLTPLDALRAATRNAAEALGVEDRLGSVREGALADLVIVDADPLSDITSTKRIWGVVKDGRWIDRIGLATKAR